MHKNDEKLDFTLWCGTCIDPCATIAGNIIKYYSKYGFYVYLYIWGALGYPDLGPERVALGPRIRGPRPGAGDAWAQDTRARAQSWGTTPKVLKLLSEFGPKVGDHSGGA